LVEEKGGQLLGWEIKWVSKSKKAPKAWKSYKNSTWQIIDKNNYLEKLT